MTTANINKGKCFCGSVEFTVSRRTRRDGLLPLQFLPGMVGGARQCLYAMAA